jgi:hypothetical protein
MCKGNVKRNAFNQQENRAGKQLKLFHYIIGKYCTKQEELRTQYGIYRYTFLHQPCLEVALNRGFQCNPLAGKLPCCPGHQTDALPLYIT